MPPEELQVTQTETPETAGGDAAASTPQPATLAEGAKVDAETSKPPADWMQDWREKASGGDEKRLAKLKTMGSPVDLANSYFELERLKDSSRRIPDLPDKPTEEQLTEYRKAVGVPRDGKYNFDLGEGFVWTEADKSMMDDFGKFAYETHMPEKYVRTAVTWQALHNRQKAEEFAKADKALLYEATTTLMQEWGPDYDGQMNAVSAFMSKLPPEDAKDILHGRTASGKVIGNHPAFLRFAANTEMQLNPASLLIPHAGGDASKTIDDQVVEVQQMRLTDQKRYYSPEYQRHVDKVYAAKAALDARKSA